MDINLKLDFNSKLLSDIENMSSLKILQQVKTEGGFLQMMDIIQNTHTHTDGLFIDYDVEASF